MHARTAATTDDDDDDGSDGRESEVDTANLLGEQPKNKEQEEKAQANKGGNK